EVGRRDIKAFRDLAERKPALVRGEHFLDGFDEAAAVAIAGSVRWYFGGDAVQQVNGGFLDVFRARTAVSSRDREHDRSALHAGMQRHDALAVPARRRR